MSRYRAFAVKEYCIILELEKVYNQLNNLKNWLLKKNINFYHISIFQHKFTNDILISVGNELKLENRNKRKIKI